MQKQPASETQVPHNRPVSDVSKDSMPETGEVPDRRPASDVNLDDVNQAARSPKHNQLGSKDQGIFTFFTFFTPKLIYLIMKTRYEHQNELSAN